MPDQNFANLVQLNEVRATSASDWSPREALLSLLRRIDAKEVEASALVIVYSVKSGLGEEERVNFVQSVPCTAMAVGMLEMGKLHIIEASRVE